jgi:hypothetical protein
VVGLKSGGRKGSKPGVRPAWARDCMSCWVWDSRDILVGYSVDFLGHDAEWQGYSDI